jgi:hypothetical protein
MKKIRNSVTSGMAFATIMAIAILFLVLPMVSNLDKTLDSMSLVGVANLVGYIGISIIFLGILSVFLILNQKENFDNRIITDCFITAIISTIFIINIISIFVIYVKQPNLLVELSIMDKIFYFFTYCNIVSVFLESPQIIWICSAILFDIFFILKLEYLAYSPVVIGEKVRKSTQKRSKYPKNSRYVRTKKKKSTYSANDVKYIRNLMNSNDRGY